ncbi:MAG: DUF3791 domain-containing protein [Erysipelotrichaceae bacterium]|nr:DUF3791 domain-containing protein [Erysipelotrichaceae bacterium]
MNSVEIGKVVKEKRLSLNMRMDDLASKTGITRQTLGSIENGASSYSFSSLLKVLGALDISLTVNSIKDAKTKRDRATRINTKLDKKVNRFLIMTIEQYAESINSPSNDVYTRMKKKDLINLIKDDYEDLHGMSTVYLNDYIGALLGDHK